MEFPTYGYKIRLVLSKEWMSFTEIDIMDIILENKVRNSKCKVKKTILLWKLFVYLRKRNNKLDFLYNTHNFWNRKLTLKTQNSRILDSWLNVNSQNKSLKPIHFFDKSKLILFPLLRNSKTQLTLRLHACCK